MQYIFISNERELDTYKCFDVAFRNYLRSRSIFPKYDRFDITFRNYLKSVFREVTEIDVEADGNCQFRALAHQLYSNEEKHSEIRKQVYLQLRKYKNYYYNFVVDSNYEDYINNIYQGPDENNFNRGWGDHITLQAAVDVYRIRIIIIMRDESGIREIIPKDCENSENLRRVTLAFYNYSNDIDDDTSGHYKSIIEKSIVSSELTDHYKMECMIEYFETNEKAPSRSKIAEYNKKYGFNLGWFWYDLIKSDGFEFKSFKSSNMKNAYNEGINNRNKMFKPRYDMSGKIIPPRQLYDLYNI